METSPQQIDRLATFILKLHFLSKFEFAVEPHGDFHEKRYMPFGDILANSMRYRKGVADR